MWWRIEADSSSELDVDSDAALNLCLGLFCFVHVAFHSFSIALIMNEMVGEGFIFYIGVFKRRAEHPALRVPPAETRLTVYSRLSLFHRPEAVER